MLVEDVLRDYTSGEHCQAWKCFSCGRIAAMGPVLGVQWTLQ